MGLFASILKSFMPGGRRRKKKRRIAARGGGGFRPSDGATDGRILLAEPFGSGGKEIAERLAGMLSAESAVETVFAGKALKKNLRVGLIERLVLAEREGRDWLADEGCDLLIWGEMEELGTVARLHFLTQSGAQDGHPGAFGMADTLDLPVPLPDDAGAIVRAVTLAALLPAASGSRRTLSERLVKHLGDAGAAVAELPEDMPQDCVISVHNTLGNAFATSFRFGAKKALSDAVQHYEAADKLVDATTAPMTWAVVNTHLGLVLEAGVKIDRSPESLLSAIKRYSAVANTLSRETHAGDWALAHMRRAMAFYKLATLQPAQAQQHLKSSASAFEEALTVYDRAQSPDRWAEVMNHYGVAQMALGGHGKADAVLQQSISTFRKVLEVRKRDAQPVLWAQTANNLGAACFALAKQTGEEHLLEEASYYFQGAVQVYRKVRGQKKKAEVIQKNLMRVQHMLSEDAA